MDNVHYQVAIVDISAHYLALTLRFHPIKSTHRLTLPAWIPGSYMIRNFARHIVQIAASDSQGPVAILQQDKQSWQLTCRGLPIEVRYLIYANDLSVRAAYLDDELLVINPACVCLAVSELERRAHHVTLLKPEQHVTENWRVSTALPRLNPAALTDFGCFAAKDYAHLIDTPIIAGIFSLQQFSIDNVPHYLVVTGDNLYDETRLLADVKAVCQVQRDTFGSLPTDLDQYWFLLWVTDQGCGGLEHQFSTLLLCDRFDLPANHQKDNSQAYQNLLGLFSHEYFHTWWVTRVKPSCFHPYQLDREQYSRQLWMYEGFTSYFDDLALVKASVITEQTYLTRLEKLISKVTRNPSNNVQSLTDSSFSAWTKFYLQDENAVNSVVSYYAKGALVALLLDAELRERGHSLANLCRALYQQHLLAGTTDESIFEQLVNWQCADIAHRLRNWITTADALPIAQTVEKLGLTLQWRSPQHSDDLSGASDRPNVPILGCGVQCRNNTVIVQHVYLGSAAHQAGLMSGDQLLALADRKITEISLPELLSRLPLNSSHSLVIFRRDRLLTLTLTLVIAPATTAMITVYDNQRLNAWLRTR